MADITITAANVVKGSVASVENGIAGATITAGQVVYKDTADSDKFKLCDSNGASALIRTPYGVALNGASAGQPVQVQRSGQITIGGTVAVGTVYVASATAGGIAPTTDLASGWYTSVLGIGISATVIALDIQSGGVAVP